MYIIIEYNFYYDKCLAKAAQQYISTSTWFNNIPVCKHEFFSTKCLTFGE